MGPIAAGRQPGLRGPRPGDPRCCRHARRDLLLEPTTHHAHRLDVGRLRALLRTCFWPGAQHHLPAHVVAGLLPGRLCRHHPAGNDHHGPDRRHCLLPARGTAAVLIPLEGTRGLAALVLHGTVFPDGHCDLPRATWLGLLSTCRPHRPGLRNHGRPVPVPAHQTSATRQRAAERLGSLRGVGGVEQADDGASGPCAADLSARCMRLAAMPRLPGSADDLCTLHQRRLSARFPRYRDVLQHLDPAQRAPLPQ